MSIQAYRNKDVTQIGGTLNDAEKEAVIKASVKPEDILNNLDTLNEEIRETYTSTPSPVGRPTAKKLQSTEVSSRQQRAIERASQLTNDLSLEEALDDIDTQVTDTTADETEQSYHQQILSLLQGASNTPSEQQIEKWKQVHGDNGVHCIALGEGDVYIFTHLKRGQWQKIQDTIAKIQQSNNPGNAEETLKEKVVQYSVLWPKPLPVEFFYNSRAGVVDSLYQVIMFNSYFLTPQQAMLLTTNL